MTPSELLGSVVGGKYRLLRVLGEGGMGMVFEAQNELTLKRVAIKVMHAALASDGQAAARMIREAQTASRVRHPNVVDVYDAGREGDTVFLVMEYLEGEPLSHAMRCGGMLLHDAIALLRDAMRGVAAAHRVGVVHRDIKPENIFLAREEDAPRPVPKVLDFGISKLTDDSLRLTNTDTTIGTPMYMSFEQLCGMREEVDLRADVYAFGVILYELITGRTPHQAQTLAQLGMLMATIEPLEASRLRPQIPAPLGDIVKRAIAKLRDQRTPRLEVLIGELTPYAQSSGFAEPLEIGHLPALGEAPTTRADAVHGLPGQVQSNPSSRITRPAAGTAPSLPAQRRTAKLVATTALLSGSLLGLALMLPRLQTPSAEPSPVTPLAGVPLDAAPPSLRFDRAPAMRPTHVAQVESDPQVLLAADAAVRVVEPAPPMPRVKPPMRRSERGGTPRPPMEQAGQGVPAPSAAPADGFRAGKPSRDEF